jgi:hypothetical protein
MAGTPLPEPVGPARGRIPGITGATVGVLIQVAPGSAHSRNTWLPAIFARRAGPAWRDTYDGEVVHPRIEFDEQQ